MTHFLMGNHKLGVTLIKLLFLLQLSCIVNSYGYDGVNSAESVSEVKKLDENLENQNGNLNNSSESSGESGENTNFTFLIPNEVITKLTNFEDQLKPFKDYVKLNECDDELDKQETVLKNNPQQQETISSSSRSSNRFLKQSNVQSDNSIANTNDFLHITEMFSQDPNKTDKTEQEQVTPADLDQIDMVWTPSQMFIPGYNGPGFFMDPIENEREWCKSKSFDITWHSSEPVRGTSKGPIKVEENKVKDIQMSPNGTLTWKDSLGVRHLHQPKHYCIIKKGKTEVRFKICQPNCTEQKPCVQKCCEKDKVMVMDDPQHKCIKANPEWTPTFYREWNQKEPTTRDYTLTFGLPNCTRKYMIQSNQELKYPNLLLNGTLLINGAHNMKTDISPGKFCIDGIYERTNEEIARTGGNNHTRVHYSQSEWHQIIIICSPDKSQVPDWIPALYATVNHTAALFLFLTALVYLLLWSHQNIHGWLQFSYAVSLFFAFNFLAIVQIWSQQIYNISHNLCAYLGWLIHLTFLSAFFWLTSMNFDLWWRFSGRRSLRRIRSKPCRENIKRFLLFALFSVGIPVLISAVAVILDNVYREMPDEAWIKLPVMRFGKGKCYFEDKKSQFPYLYGPVGVLLLIDLLFFTSTVMHLRKIHSNTELARSNSTLEDKKGVRLIAKLFIVMGVLWVFEFISWAANVLFPDSELLLIWLFMPTEILNSLQGIAIFVIFICKPNVLSQLNAKYHLI